MRATSFLILSLVVAAASAGVQASNRPTPVASLDIDRYQGTWYEIARFPNRFQKDCQGNVTARYTIRPDGKIEVLNRCQEEDGTFQQALGLARRAADNRPFSQLKVRFAPSWLAFLPFVWADYWVLDLDPEYRWAAVGTPNREYLWILSRSPQLESEIYESIVERLTAQGFAVERLVATQNSNPE